MPAHTKSYEPHSPLALFTELAVEGTASLVEAQRTLLNLAQQENEIILDGIKERIGGFVPAMAMTDLVKRSVDTFITMHQELLTNTSKQTLHWLESEKTGKGQRSARLVEFAREGVETFTRAQKKFLDVLGQEAAKATSGKHEHDGKPAKKTELSQLAREAGNAFVEAQKRLLDVMGQQMNVNLDLATRSLELIAPAQLLPVANLAGETVKSFVDTEKSILGSVIRPSKKAAVKAKHKPGRVVRPKAVPA